MAVLDVIRSFFIPGIVSEPEIISPAPPCEYSLRTLVKTDLAEILRLNLRCFRNGENYTRHTFDYLLNEPNTVGFSLATTRGDIVAFAFCMVKTSNAAHLTTIGVAPEHRRRRLALQLIENIEDEMRRREVWTLMLEVRIGNSVAQDVYRRAGYTVVQRVNNYYTNGEDCFLMMKALYQ